MPVTFRPATAADAAACGPIQYRAFAAIADQHNFPRDIPSAEAAVGGLSRFLGKPGFHSIVAERDGQIIGSVIADERAQIANIRSISVDPDTQNAGVGRTLMQAALDHLQARELPGIRLIQAAYHNRSLCLYTTLGFRVREPLSVMQGRPLNLKFTGHEVRPATEQDVSDCNLLCRKVHGFDRGVELREAIGARRTMVVEHLGRITGYTTSVGFGGHTIAETNIDLMALIGAAPDFPGAGFLLPSRNHEVFTWCLANGLRLVMQMTLMTIGLYDEPAGAWLPSIGT